jgi:hypothetical protein
MTPTTPPDKSTPSRNIPMTVLGWVLLAIVVSLTVLIIEALFFSLAVH